MTTTDDRLAGLSLHIDGYAVDGLTRRVSAGFRRFTTVFRLTGVGLEGVGEDVTYEAGEHRRLQRAGPQLPLTGSCTLDTFSRHLERLDIFPEGPPAANVSLAHRRWALESAALDLACARPVSHCTRSWVSPPRPCGSSSR